MVNLIIPLLIQAENNFSKTEELLCFYSCDFGRLVSFDLAEGLVTPSLMCSLYSSSGFAPRLCK